MTIWTDFMGHAVAERFYEPGGLRTRVLEAGEGPPLVLLHGTGGHAEAYCRNIGALGERFRVLAVDLLGHGFTAPSPAGYMLDDYCNHLGLLLDLLEIERAFFSGESLGAAVASWFAITRPERATRLILNTGVLARPDAQGMAELAELARRTEAVTAAGLTRETVRQRMEWLVKDPASMTDELVECRYRIYSQPGMLETVAQVMAAAGAMWSGRAGDQYFAEGVLGRIRCPTLLLWTEHNPGQGVEFVRRLLPQFSDARLVFVPECGHWPQFERPEEVNRHHVEFLLEPAAV